MAPSQSDSRLPDVAPTLTDTQVLEFCRNGYLLLEGVVPDDVNLLTADYCRRADFYEPSEILDEAWFVEQVVLNPQAAGAVRSLLGRAFHLPVSVTNHHIVAPFSTGPWHLDGNSVFSHRLDNVLAFYYPQDTPLEMGPTQVLPGSHLVRNQTRFMAHLNGIRGAVATAAPAGSIFLADYQIWHRRGPATGRGVRNLLRYFYWRTTPPTRDWLVEDDFDLATVRYGPPIAPLMDNLRADLKVAETFLWLCGKHDGYRNLGGQSWPMPGRRRGPAYGLPENLD